MNKLNILQSKFPVNLDKLQVNDTAEFMHIITEENVKQFAELTGDYNPLHLDESFAKKARFKKPVVYGMLTASYISTMIGMVLPGTGALWTSQTLEFISPVYVGDRIKVTANIKHISRAIRTLVLDIKIFNQNNDVVVSGESKVKLLEVESEDEDVLNEKKIVLITGGSKGIGAEIAKKLSNEGYIVIINYNSSEDQAHELLTEIKSTGGLGYCFKADVSKYQEVKHMFDTIKKEIGTIQAVVHCAAPKGKLKPYEELSWEDFEEQLNIQLKGAYYCTQLAIPDMLALQQGAIIFIGSIVSDGVPPVNQSDYVVAKTALSSLAKTLAVEYGYRGIRINVVAPGMTKTDRIDNMPEKAKIVTKMQTPLRRLGEPNDVANAVSFLLSPGAQYITGQTLRVCGGIVME